MPVPTSEPGSLSRGEKWTFAIILLLILAMFGADIAISFTTTKLSALFILGFWIPLLVTHEFGHALAARLLGWHVGRITLGFGRRWARLDGSTCFIEIRSFPVTGFIQCVPTHLRQPRLRDALIYFAGPGADLLVGGLVMLIVGADLFNPSTEVGMIAWQSLALAAFAQGILNLIPLPNLTSGKIIVNDGMGILRAPTLPDSHYAQLIEGFREHGREIFEGEPDDDDMPAQPPAPDSNSDEWWKKDRRL